MAAAIDLEERFNVAVRTIQNLPADGVIQPSNLTKLIFYGLYKQATLGPCKDSRPSVFNYVARAKWDAWDRCRSMTKEQAMLAYIDEIRKIVENMPQTEEVVEFAQLIGFSDKRTEIQSRVDDSTTLTSENQDQTTMNKSNQLERPILTPHDSMKTLAAARNDPISSCASSSSSSSSSSSPSPSSISTSDIDELYDDASDFVIPTYDEITLNHSSQQQPINTTTPPHVLGGQNEANISIRDSTSAGSHYSNAPSSSFRHHGSSSNTNHHTTSYVASGRNHERYPADNSSKNTQRAILTALTKLQGDIHHILERLNRLETLTYLLQQKELAKLSQVNSSSRWFPLSGFRRGAVAFILLWPFVAFLLTRLFLHAKIIIRFRRQHP